MRYVCTCAKGCTANHVCTHGYESNARATRDVATSVCVELFFQIQAERVVIVRYFDEVKKPYIVLGVFYVCFPSLCVLSTRGAGEEGAGG